MKRLLALAAMAAVLLTPAVAGAEHGSSHRQVTRTKVVQEWNIDGTAIDSPPVVGRSRLVRTEKRLRATTRMRGLEPGGLYTFWWIVVQEDGTFPDDIFAALGGGVVVGEDGTARVRMSAKVGQPGITGFMPDGVNEIPFSALTDTLGSTVRIEVAYHGQASDAGDQIHVWLDDFWTGTACPPNTPNPNPAQPHCPVYYAATHAPG